MEKFAIHIAGPSCSGKTTLSDALGEKFPGLYILSFDKLKWQLAGYNRDQHSNLIKNIELGVFEVICKQAIPLTLNYFCQNAQEYATLQKIADQNGYKFISVQLTAPEDVLLSRFRERAQRAKQIGSKITITDEAMFLKLLEEKFYLPPSTPVFDTAKLSPEAIALEVIKLIEKA